jgi:hypothetical protein
MIDFNKIEATPEGLKAALQEMRSDFDSHNHDGFNSKTFQALSTQSLTAEVISIRKQNYSDSKAGFWVGLMSNSPAMFIGEGTKYLKYDIVNGLQIQGGIITGGKFQTGASGDRIVIDGTVSSKEIQFYDGSNKIGRIVPTTSSFGEYARGFRMQTSDTSLDGAYIEMKTNVDNDNNFIRFRVIKPSVGEDPNYGMKLEWSPDDSATYALLEFGDYVRVSDSTTAFAPLTDQNTNLGASGAYWDSCYLHAVNYYHLNNMSDESLKSKIADLSYGLKELRQLKPRTFNYIDGNEEGVGFVAQELQSVIPEMVVPATEKESLEEFEAREGKKGEKRRKIVQLKPDGDPLWSIQQDMFIPLLVKSIQELADKVETLEKKIKVLENKQ